MKEIPISCLIDTGVQRTLHIQILYLQLSGGTAFAT